MLANTEKKQLVLSLRDKEGLTFKEIGVICGVSKQRAQQLYTLEYKDRKPPQTHRERVKNMRSRYESLRTQALFALGGRCTRCDNRDYRCLQLDHIHGGGKKDTRKSYYRYLFIIHNTEEARKEFQILCANCNWIKRYENNEVPRVYLD